MGREIRRVPLGWQHPTIADLAKFELYYSESTRYTFGEALQSHSPQLAESYVPACRAWLDQAKAWDDGTHEDLVAGHTTKDECPFYWDWSDVPPRKTHYRFGPWDFKPEDATCFQVYENVSEGTPTSPVFETLADLKDWLIAQGHSEQNADAFIRMGSVFSMVVGPEGLTMGIDSATLQAPEANA